MTRKALFTILVLTFSISAFAQDNTDTITSTKVFGGYKFEQNGKVLTLKGLSTLMQNDSEATGYLKKAKTAASFSNVLASAGGFFIGYPIGTAIGGGKPVWALAGIGCGLVIIALPLSSAASKNAKTAVDIYNANGRNLSFNRKYDLNLGLSTNGLSLKLRF
jgi:hypothetical protein